MSIESRIQALEAKCEQCTIVIQGVEDLIESLEENSDILSKSDLSSLEDKTSNQLKPNWDDVSNDNHIIVRQDFDTIIDSFYLLTISYKLNDAAWVQYCLGEPGGNESSIYLSGQLTPTEWETKTYRFKAIYPLTRLALEAHETTGEYPEYTSFFKDISITKTTEEVDNICHGYSGDGDLAIYAKLYEPRGVFVDNGTIYIADTNNHVIRKVVAGIITTIAGIGEAGFEGDEGIATEAKLNMPYSVFIESNKIYIADTGNHRIRMIDNNIITTVAGSCGATQAPPIEYTTLHGFCFDENGMMYFYDVGCAKLKMYCPITGRVVHLAGNGSEGYSGDESDAKQATLSKGYDNTDTNTYSTESIQNIIAVGTKVYMDCTGVDGTPLSNSERIRYIDTETGIINTLIGGGNPSTYSPFVSLEPWDCAEIPPSFEIEYIGYASNPGTNIYINPKLTTASIRRFYRLSKDKFNQIFISVYYLNPLLEPLNINHYMHIEYIVKYNIDTGVCYAHINVIEHMRQIMWCYYNGYLGLYDGTWWPIDAIIAPNNSQRIYMCFLTTPSDESPRFDYGYYTHLIKFTYTPNSGTSVEDLVNLPNMEGEVRKMWIDSTESFIFYETIVFDIDWDYDPYNCMYGLYLYHRIYKLDLQNLTTSLIKEIGIQGPVVTGDFYDMSNFIPFVPVFLQLDADNNLYMLKDNKIYLLDKDTGEETEYFSGTTGCGGDSTIQQCTGGGSVVTQEPIPDNKPYIEPIPTNIYATEIYISQKSDNGQGTCIDMLNVYIAENGVTEEGTTYLPKLGTININYPNATEYFKITKLYYRRAKPDYNGWDDEIILDIVLLFGNGNRFTCTATFNITDATPDAFSSNIGEQTLTWENITGHTYSFSNFN